MTDEDKITIMLVDDHRRVHQAISEMIGFIDDFELVAQANNGREAVALCQRHNPDVVLMDVVMPEMDGVEATRLILEAQPHIKILALSSFREQETAQAMLKNGALGFVLKDLSVMDLENTIRTAHEGQSVLSPEIMQSLVQSSQAAPPDNIDLTPRELEVLPLFAAGMTNGEIAMELSISVSTVKFHIRNILDKLGVETRAEALVIAAKHNLV